MFPDIPINDGMVFNRAKDQVQFFQTGGQPVCDSKNSGYNWQPIEFKGYEDCGAAKDTTHDNKNKMQMETPTYDPIDQTRKMEDGNCDVNLIDMVDKYMDNGLTGINWEEQ